MTKKDYILLANIIKSNSGLAIVRGDPKHIIKYGEFMLLLLITFIYHYNKLYNIYRIDRHFSK